MPRPAPLAFALLICASSACQPDAPRTQQLREDLQVQTVRAAVSGLSEPVTVEVPPGTGSLLIEVAGARGRYFLSKLATPAGRDLVTAGTYVTRESEDTHGGQVDWLLPNTPDEPSLRIQPGTYQLLVRGETLRGGPLTEDVAVSFYFKSEPVEGGSCGISLDFLVADDAIAPDEVGSTAETLATSLDELLAPTGIDVVDYKVSVLRLPGGSAARGDRPGVIVDRVAELLSFAAREEVIRPGALHVILVKRLGYLRPASGELMTGFSLGLPGPFERSSSNAAILLASNIDDAGRLSLDGLSSTLAHEMGHYLGLLHTSERGLELHDPLDDTPQCESGCDNVMAPLGGSGRGDQFTPDQVWVMQRHPLCAPPGAILAPHEPIGPAVTE